MSDTSDSISRALTSAHEGNQRPLQQLIEDNLPWIEARVRKRLSPAVRLDGDTHDFVQEAILDVLKDGPGFAIDSPDDFRALLARIVENTLIDRKRYMQRDRRDRRRERALPETAAQGAAIKGRTAASPLSQAATNERQAWLRLALELLEPEDREAIRLRDWQGLGFAEAGAHFGVSEEAMRKRYHRALPKLAQKLELLRRGGWQDELRQS